MDNTRSRLYRPIPAPIKGLPAGVRYSRSAGIAVGLFLIAWGPACLVRWGIASVGLGWFQGMIAWVLAACLLMSWSKPYSSKTWWSLWAIAAISVMAFSVLQIGDVVYQHIGLAAMGMKLKPPVFHGTLIFLALLQLPTFVFIRYPQTLD